MWSQVDLLILVSSHVFCVYGETFFWSGVTYIYIYFKILNKFILKTKISKRVSYFANILNGRVTFINSYLHLFMREREKEGLDKVFSRLRAFFFFSTVTFDYSSVNSVFIYCLRVL